MTETSPSRERRVSIAILAPDAERAIVRDLDSGENIANEIALCHDNLAAIRRALVEPLPLGVSLATMHAPPRIVDGELLVWQASYQICELVL